MCTSLRWGDRPFTHSPAKGMSSSLLESYIALPARYRRSRRVVAPQVTRTDTAVTTVDRSSLLTERRWGRPETRRAYRKGYMRVFFLLCCLSVGSQRGQVSYFIRSLTYIRRIKMSHVSPHLPAPPSPQPRPSTCTQPPPHPPHPHWSDPKRNACCVPHFRAGRDRLSRACCLLRKHRSSSARR